MIELRIDQKQFEEIRKRLENVGFLSRANIYIHAMNNIANLTERKLKANVSGNILKRRSGRLANSIGSRVVATGGGIAGVVGSGIRSGNRVPYADIHENGGVIRGNPFLAVPLPSALTKAGNPKRSHPRDWENTFVQRSKNGNLIIFQKKQLKTKTKLTPLYVLKKSVKVPARRYLSRTLDQMTSRIAMILSGTVERALNGKT